MRSAGSCGGGGIIMTSRLNSGSRSWGNDGTRRDRRSGHWRDSMTGPGRPARHRDRGADHHLPAHGLNIWGVGLLAEGGDRAGHLCGSRGPVRQRIRARAVKVEHLAEEAAGPTAVPGRPKRQRGTRARAEGNDEPHEESPSRKRAQGADEEAEVKGILLKTQATSVVHRRRHQRGHRCGSLGVTSISVTERGRFILSIVSKRPA